MDSEQTDTGTTGATETAPAPAAPATPAAPAPAPEHAHTDHHDRLGQPSGPPSLIDALSASIDAITYAKAVDGISAHHRGMLGQAHTLIATVLSELEARKEE